MQYLFVDSLLTSPGIHQFLRMKHSTNEKDSVMINIIEDHTINEAALLVVMRKNR